MELIIKSDNESKLLNRREIKFEVEQEHGTINKEELKRQICRKLNLDPDSTIVVHIKQGYGSKESSGTAHAYQSKEMLEKYEPKHLLERISKKAGKKEEEKKE